MNKEEVSSDSSLERIDTVNTEGQTDYKKDESKERMRPGGAG